MSNQLVLKIKPLKLLLFIVAILVSVRLESAGLGLMNAASDLTMLLGICITCTVPVCWAYYFVKRYNNLSSKESE